MLNHMKRKRTTKDWKVYEPSENRKELASCLGISEISAQILINRGVESIDKARAFLNPGLDMLHDPFSFNQMKKSVARILSAIDNNERILVYGDYDVDGITSISILLSTLKFLGANADFYVPNRLEEGYGLNSPAIKKAVGTSLIVTVDCGITANEEIAIASQYNMDVIITDHHEPPIELPAAYSIINPKISEDNYPFTGLCGAGIAFKLAQALMIEKNGAAGEKSAIDKYLEFASLATIADIVPLVDENRIITKYGLSKLENTNNPGLRALLNVCGLEGKKLDAIGVGYTLAPRINAVGRMGDPALGIKLLLTESHKEAERIASILDEQNRERKVEENKIVEEALELVDSTVDLARDKVIVLAEKGWHTGIIGIVASRISEIYYRPCMLLSLDNGEAIGSARSIENFHIYEALCHCSDLLLRFGGHEQAAGLAILPERIDVFREEINRYASKVITPGDLLPKLNIDYELDLNNVSLELVDELDRLAPFGADNPGPVMVARNIDIVGYRAVGKEGRHLKLKVRSEKGNLIDGIGFDLAEFCDLLFDNPENLDIAFYLQENTWNGRTDVQLNILDIRDSDSDNPFISYLFSCEKTLAQGMNDRGIDWTTDVKNVDLIKSNRHKAYKLKQIKELLKRGKDHPLVGLEILDYIGIDKGLIKINENEISSLLKALLEKQHILYNTPFLWSMGLYGAIFPGLASIVNGSPVIFICLNDLSADKLHESIYYILGNTGMIIDKISFLKDHEEQGRIHNLLQENSLDVLITTEKYFNMYLKDKSLYGEIPQILCYFLEKENLNWPESAKNIVGSIETRSKEQKYPSLCVITDFVNEMLQEGVFDYFSKNERPIHDILSNEIQVCRTDDKIKLVEDLIGEGKKLLIYVNYRQRAVNIARILSRQIRDKNITFYHGQVLSKDRVVLAHMIKENKIDALVATDSFTTEGAGHNFDHLLFFDLPFGKSHFLSQCLSGGENCCIKLLFSKLDVTKTMKKLAEYYPDRKTLVKFYLGIRKICSENNCFNGTKRQIIKYFNDCSDLQPNEGLLDRALQVFMDLGLVSVSCKQDTIYIEFGMGANNKVDLRKSHTYMEGKLVRENYKKWAKHMLSKEKVEISDLIR